jgi:DNA transformation protein
MGENGARQSTAGAAMAERLIDDLAPLGDVTTKKMFGGYGVFEDAVMFALVDSTGGAFLRADDATSEKFVAAGSEAHGRMPYWRIPQTVLDDSTSLLEWAMTARDVARAAKKN